MLRKFYIGVALILFTGTVFHGLDRWAHHKSRKFSVEKITATHRFSPEWEVPPQPAEEREELTKILSQTFTYYDRGCQSIAFISEDKNYILKFLQQRKFFNKTWLSYIPLAFNPYYQERLFKEQTRNSALFAFKTAYTHLKDQTGLLYVHLNNKPDLKKEVTIWDKNGNRHTVKVDQTIFCVQKHARLIYSRISELMHQNDVEKAKKVISSVFELITYLRKTGIVDNDPVLEKNFGLIDDIAVQIDVGRLRLDPNHPSNVTSKRHVEDITHQLKYWLDENYPELSLHYQACLEKISE